MTVYHGSNQAVPAPDILHSRKNVDFGPGFYVTPLAEQARRWCARFKRNDEPGILSVYTLDESALSNFKSLRFDAYDEAWLDYVLACRRGEVPSDHDVVLGGVADDRVFDTIELLHAALIDRREALNRLRYFAPNYQICLRSQAVMDAGLRFLRGEAV